MGNITKLLVKSALIAGISFSGAANAALISVYNLAGNGFLTPNISSIAEAEAVVDPANLLATETTNMINYGPFASSFPGAGFPIINTFVLTALGSIDTNAYSHLSVRSDDGFELELDGTPFSMFDGNRALSFTTTPLGNSGIVSFELLYWENTGGQGLQVFGRGSNGWSLASVGDPIAAVPEPNILALAGIGLIGLGFSRRRRTSK